MAISFGDGLDVHTFTYMFLSPSIGTSSRLFLNSTSYNNTVALYSGVRPSMDDFILRTAPPATHGDVLVEWTSPANTFWSGCTFYGSGTQVDIQESLFTEKLATNSGTATWMAMYLYLNNAIHGVILGDVGNIASSADLKLADVNIYADGSTDYTIPGGLTFNMSIR